MPNYLDDEEEEDETPEERAARLRQGLLNQDLSEEERQTLASRPISSWSTEVNDKEAAPLAVPTDWNSHIAGSDRLAPIPEEDDDDEDTPDAPVAIAPGDGEALDDDEAALTPVKRVDPATGKTVITDPDYYGKSLSSMRSLLGGAPVKTQPKWWERVAAGAAGGLAGWTNAAGRARPIDIGKMQENILHPGYESKLEEWRSRVAPAKAALELEQQAVTNKQKGQEAEAKVEELGSRAGMEDQRGEYYANRKQNPWRVEKDGSLVNTQTGETKSKPPSPQERYALALSLTGDKSVASHYALGISPPAAKAPNETQLLMDAAKGDPTAAKALQLQQEGRIRIARESRPPAAAAGLGGLDHEAIVQAADAYNAGAGIPNLGYGKEGAAIKQQIMNEAAKRKPGNDLAGAKQDYAATGGAIKDQEKMFGRIKTMEGTAGKNIDLADSISKQVDRTGSPVINKYLLQLKGQYAGDDNTTLLQNAVETAANEYAGVVSGTGGGATDSARDHARQMLNASMAQGTFSKVAAQMKQEMNNRRTSYEQTLRESRSGRKPQPGSTPQPQGPPAPTAPAGKPWVQHSPKTGQYRYSIDGGRTWQPGQPPPQ